MTEEIAATPGWVEQRLETVFAGLPDAERDRYADCLARQKVPGGPSDELGTEFAGCRPMLRRALIGAGIAAETLDALDAQLAALEAEIAVAT
ncbi:MAG: hypothetical protein H7Z10_08110 [Gemmatimonadaceae bacterium]|nr:hypothetical protein [Acetobacteraceae bacterium]